MSLRLDDEAADMDEHTGRSEIATADVGNDGDNDGDNGDSADHNSQQRGPSYRTPRGTSQLVPAPFCIGCTCAGAGHAPQAIALLGKHRSLHRS